MLVCKITQYLWSVCIALHKECTFMWSGPLSHGMFIACSIGTHTSYFIVSSCNYRMKCFTACWTRTPGIQQIKLKILIREIDLDIITLHCYYTRAKFCNSNPSTIKLYTAAQNKLPQFVSPFVKFRKLCTQNLLYGS